MAKIKISNLISHFEISSEEEAIITELNSKYQDGYHFSPSYRIGAWDGMVRMFNSKAKTLPSGLVPDTIIELQNAGYQVDVVFDEDQEVHPREDAIINFEITEEHQLRGLEAMCENRRGIVHAATNAGKTKIAEAWCALHKLKTVYFVGSKELLRQTVASFQNDTNLDVGWISAEEGWHIGKDVTVCLVTSVAKRSSKKKIGKEKCLNPDAVKRFQEISKEFEAVIVDECHHMVAETWRWSVRQCKNARRRFGLSGTPWESESSADALYVKALLGPVIARITNAELIDKGWSAKPKISLIEVQSPPIAAKNINGDKIEFSEVYDTGIVYNTLRNNMIVNLCQKKVDEKKSCLVISTRLAQCDILSEMLTTQGISHRVIVGDSDSQQRKQDLIDFRNGEYPILISTVLGEGIDIPALNSLIFASGGKAFKQILQRVGRGIRKKHSGDNTVQIYDFIDKAHANLRSHTRERLKIYEKEGFETNIEHVRF